MRLRVCLIIPTLVQGGAEKQLFLLAANLPKNQFDVHVVVLTHSGPYEARLHEAGVAVHVVGKKFKFDPSSYVRLEWLLKRISPHVVHTWLFAANSYGRLAAHRARVPVIIAGERCVDSWKSSWHLRIDRWLMKYTNCVAANTPAIAEYYADRGFDRDRFRIIPNAIVPNPQNQISKAELFRRLNLPARSMVVGAIGRLWPQKGYPELLWAAELLRVALRDVWLIIVGDGPDRERLQHLRDQYGAQNAVRFVGHRKDASELLTAFDLLWNGSLYEGQSNTILEAMAAGVPVIATDIPGNRDLIEHEKTGFLYPRGEVAQLARLSNCLLTAPHQLESFAKRARQRVDTQFSLDAMIQAHIAMYQELYASRHSLPEH